MLSLSDRQAKRVYARYRSEGDVGVVQRLRGRRSNRQTDEEKRVHVLKRFAEKSADFGPTLATEYLAGEDGVDVAVETLRQWLKGAGLWQARRKRSAHRKWRARREHPGEMVQWDGSHHDWFEGRRSQAVLMVLIDDATNRAGKGRRPASACGSRCEVDAGALVSGGTCGATGRDDSLTQPRVPVDNREPGGEGGESRPGVGPVPLRRATALLRSTGPTPGPRGHFYL